VKLLLVESLLNPLAAQTGIISVLLLLSFSLICKRLVEGTSCLVAKPRGHQLPRLLVVLPLLLATPLFAADRIDGEEFCTGPVADVEFSGNDTTRNRVLLEQLRFAPGDECSLDALIDGIQSIMDLGLFRRVLVSIPSGQPKLVVSYQVVEKYYFFPLPRFSRTSDGELRLGGQLRWDNFRGLNHQIKLTSERREEDDGRGPGGQHHELEYRIPRFLGSDFGLSTEIEHRRQRKELVQDGVDYGFANGVDNTFKLQLSRWFNQGGVTRGTRFRFGIRLQRRSLDMIDGELGPFKDGFDAVFNVGLESRDVHDDLFRLRGRVAGINVQLAFDELGSDFDYNRIDVYYRRYKPLSGLNLRNLNYQLRIGISNEGPFGERHFSLGGGEKMRGMQTGYRTGDLMMLANIEYLAALPSNQALRGVLFADIGNVYRHNDFNPFKHRLGLGAGIRWKLLRFSNTDLRFDAAWDNRERKLRYYFSTDLTF